MRRWWVKLIIAIVTLALIVGGALAYWFYQQRWNPEDPTALVTKAMVETLQSSDFRFESRFFIRVDGRDELVSRFSGERSGGETFHLKGVILQSPTEIFLVGPQFYLWDPLKKGWYSIEKADFGPQDLLLKEISPLSVLEVSDIQDAVVVSREKSRDIECLVLELNATVTNKLLTTLWKDFQYRIWVDPWKEVVHKAVIEATSRNAPEDRLHFTVEFWDYDQKIEVILPTLMKEKEATNSEKD
ncbi:hypothetical protein F9B85_05095 [Heliorestis acidaminivorans]|uniref:DUF2092 domain-containing protein n=1 Tax=Heliorestis acidaminivorans TaxID=553427 RepID=A0A6I0ES21_9FIRM|nr:hypothetical protein [Heliorestis acidaminivorans]KAB2953290.1 hypothetical protein F9B85_05095 [Heliorestis acidaminivorans]